MFGGSKDVAFNQEIADLVGTVEVKWRHRNKVTQGAGLIPYGFESIAAPATVTYVVRMYDATTNDLLGDLLALCRFGRMIDRRRIALVETHRDRRAKGFAHPGAQTPDALLDKVLDFRLEAADRPPQDRFFGNHIERITPMNLRHADNRRLARMNLA